MKLLLERMQSSLIKKESEYKTPKLLQKHEIICYYKFTHIHLLFSKFYKLVDRSYNKLIG